MAYSPVIEEKSANLLNLNLGCGSQKKPGFINVDRDGDPDFRWDLEKFPWPWPNDSVGAVSLIHVLEHLGRDTETYLGIWKELYRVCAKGAKIHIRVPHPRHDDFINDPTHVRPVTVESIALFSKRLNRVIQENGGANTPLAIYLNVDFEMTRAELQLEEPWLTDMRAGRITQKEVETAVLRYSNIVKQVDVDLVVVK